MDSHEAPHLARKQMLHLGCLFMHCRQEYIHELHGVLALGTSLRLEAALLAVCFRGISSDFSTEHGPPSSEQDPVDPSVSLSYEEASISLLSLSITGQTD